MSTEPAYTIVPSIQPPKWICTTCTGVGAEQPGNCPRCGRAFEPGALSSDSISNDREFRSMSRRLWLALLLGVPLILMGVIDAVIEHKPLKNTLGDQWFLAIEALLCTPVVCLCAAPFFVRAWRSIRTRRLNLYTLIGLGIGSAYIYSLVAIAYEWSGARPLERQVPADSKLQAGIKTGVEVVAPYQRGTIDPFFESAAMIVILALLGEVLEIRARARSGEAIRKLMPYMPKTARLILDEGREEERDLDQVVPGSLVRVRPGERIPVDGIVRAGSSAVDESMLTGEPVRVQRVPGSRVLAGSENGLGELTIETTGVREDTVLDQVVVIVARAQQRRVTLQRTADRVAAWFVPIVLLVALVTFAAWAAFGPSDSGKTSGTLCAVAVLIVACPCAVCLATPTAVAAGMRAAANRGVLFRDAATLERLASVDTVLFDKTGTLTEGRPRLTAVKGNVGVAENAVLAIAAAIERGSEHPLGLAIVWEAVRRGLDLDVAEKVEFVAGEGVLGLVEGQRVVVGRIGFLQRSGVHRDLMLSEAMSHRKQGHGVVLVGKGDQCIGIIVLNDATRTGAREAVDELRNAGLRLILLTGDHEATAQGVASVVGIEEVMADALPAEKYAVVQKLKSEGRVVAMCGDGINDAPALAAADVGIAVGTGTRAAIGTAGVTLANADLRAIGTARELSRATVKTIRQNLFLAFAFNSLAIPIAAGALVPFGGGLINSIWAAAAMSISSLLVIANSQRLAIRSS